MYQSLSNHLKTLSNLPMKLFKYAIESIVVKELAKYLGKFLHIFSLNIDSNILLIIAFTLLASISYFILSKVMSLFKNKKSNSSSSSSSSSDSVSKSKNSDSCTYTSLLSSSSNSDSDFTVPEISSDSSSC